MMPNWTVWYNETTNSIINVIKLGDEYFFEYKPDEFIGSEVPPENFDLLYLGVL